MPELPSGTVTFLFTDVEGSTRLLQELGDRYADVLAEHRRVLRDAFARHSGVEVDTQGDAFFVAFAKASDALAAAAEARKALADGPIRVRIGVHTGEPVVTEEGYVGIDVHRAARIAAAGHGGQILVSQSTRDLADANGLHDLGEHRLKDLTAPERIYQLGDGDFPPLKSLNQTNLPVQPTPLIGRERELAEAGELLATHRLLTLVGPGGTGKTRLALQLAVEAADEFEHGVWWIPLAAVEDPDLVEPEIAQAVGAKDGVVEHLRSRKVLLLLDNFEHLLPASPRIAELLRAAPYVKAIVTSRAPLRVSAEQEFPVSPLPEADAVALFTERARAVKPTFAPDEHVREICRRLDGLPLALELAAARIKVLPPPKLVERLEHALPLLTGGARDVPERQRTLQATIEWSYRLLDDEERRLFARLAVFAGSFSLEAAEEICDATIDVVQRLVDNSLLRETDDGRFFFLDTLREYARGRLRESAELADVADRHAAYFARLADRRWAELVTGETDWREVVEREYPNLHAAVVWALERGRGPEVLAIASGIGPFWIRLGYLRQAQEWVESALRLGPPRMDSTRGHALLMLCDLVRNQGDLATASRLIDEALRIFRALDEQRAVAVALLSAADNARLEGDYGRARELAEGSVALRRAHADFALGRALLTVAEIARGEGDYDGARAALEESLEWFRTNTPDNQFIVGAFVNLGELALAERDDRSAMRAFADALRGAVRMGDELHIADVLDGVAGVRSLRADARGAARLAAAAERLREERGAVRLIERPQPERVEPAWSEGRAMSLDEAIEYALNS